MAAHRKLTAALAAALVLLLIVAFVAEQARDRLRIAHLSQELATSDAGRCAAS